MVARQGGVPIPQGRVRMEGRTGDGTTVSKGRAVIGPLPQGQYGLAVSAYGYRPYRDTIVLTDTRVLRIVLPEIPRSLDDICGGCASEMRSGRPVPGSISRVVKDTLLHRVVAQGRLRLG